MARKQKKLQILWVILAVSVFVALSFDSSYARKMPYKGITLNLCAMRAPDHEAIYTQLPEFERRTGIKVNVSYFTWSDMNKEEKMDFATGAGAYDVVTGADWSVGEFVAAGWIEPIDRFLEDPKFPNAHLEDIMPAIMEESCIRDEKIYGFPINHYLNMFGYRKDLYKEYGIVDGTGNTVPAETFYDMLRNALMCTKDTDGDGRIDLYGLAMFPSKGGPLTYDIGSYLWSYGSGYIDMNTKRTMFASPQGMEAMKLYSDLILKYDITPTGVLSFAHAEFTDAMRTGLTAMGIFFQEAVGAPMEDPKYSKVVGKIAYGLIPGRRLPSGKIERVPNFGAFALHLNKNSKNKEAAYLLINYLTSQETAKGRLMAGAKAFRYSDFEIPEVLEKYPYFILAKESLKTARHIPIVPEWMTFSKNFNRYYHEVLTGAAKLEPAMKEAAEKIDEVLRKAYP